VLTIYTSVTRFPSATFLSLCTRTLTCPEDIEHKTFSFTIQNFRPFFYMRKMFSVKRVGTVCHVQHMGHVYQAEAYLGTLISLKLVDNILRLFCCKIPESDSEIAVKATHQAQAEDAPVRF